MKILVTGISGFLGSELLRHMSNDGHQYYCVVRKQSLQKLKDKIIGSPNIIPLIGDLTSQHLIEIDNSFDTVQLKKEIDVILHAGALYNLESTKEDSYIQNVVGTQNVVNFARQCPNLKKFQYVSTIAVAGDAKGVFKEEDLSLGQKFSNFYSESKYKAELMVRGARLQGVDVTIYRPGILIANSRDWEITNINGPYYLFATLKKLKPYGAFINRLPQAFLPFREAASFPLVPVDDVANAVYQGLLQNDFLSSGIKTYHLIAPNCPSVGEFIQKTFKEFNFPGRVRALKQSRLSPYLLKAFHMPIELLQYMYSEVDFSTKNALEDFSGKIQDFKTYEKDFYSNGLN
jgi:thioester reductase-like protein